MTSPLSGATLTAQRAQNRWVRYHLAISDPEVVYTARINQTFDSLDNIIQLIYDTGSGTLSRVLPNMTVLIGSTAGARDIAVLRVRKQPTATILYIGKVSGVQFSDNQYITILADWRINARIPGQVTGVTQGIDEDITYTAARAGAPIVNIGPTAYVINSGSFTPTATAILEPGRTVVSYRWTARGASSTSNMTTASPTITYSTPGEYYVTCTVTDSAGGHTLAVRKVFYQPSDTATFQVSDITGNVDDGGWSCKIEGYSGVDTDAIQDGTLVVLWKKDYTGTALATQYGPYAGAENIRLIGWVDGQSISVNPYFGTVSFSINGPAWWLGSVAGTPTTLINSTSASWDCVSDMTTDRALRRLLFQTTAPDIMDFHFTGATAEISNATISNGKIYQQLSWLVQEKQAGRFLFDRFGAGYFVIPINLTYDRSGIETLWTISASDWTSFDPGDRITVPPAAMIEVSGLLYTGTDAELWSRAPGNTPNQYGEVGSPYNGLAIPSQAQLNRLAGDLLENDNNEWPGVDFELGWANDFLDLVPLYYIKASMTAAQNPRGIVWTNKKFCVLSVVFEFDNISGAEHTSFTLEAETNGNNGVTYVPPEPPVPNIPNFPTPGGGGYGGGVWIPPIIPTKNCEEGTNLSWDVSFLDSVNGPTSAFAYVEGTLRSSGAGGTMVTVNYVATGPFDRTAVTLYALDQNKARIETATRDTSFGTGYSSLKFFFLPAVETDFYGFELAITAGTGTGSETDPLIPAFVFVTENTTGLWCYNQLTNAWTNLTTAYTGAELAALGNGFLAVPLYGDGTGGIYISSPDYGLYAGDVTVGLTKIADNTYFTGIIGTTARTWWIASNPYTGEFALHVLPFSNGGAQYIFSGAFGTINYNGAANGGIAYFAKLSYFSDSGVYMFMSALSNTGFWSSANYTDWTNYALPAGADGNYTRGAGHTQSMLFWQGTQLYTSGNDGSSWTTKGISPYADTGTPNQYAIDETASTVMVAGGTQLYLSTDGGSTFSILAKVFPSCTFILNYGGTNWLHCTNGGINAEIVTYSNDDGANWIDLSGDLYAQLVALGVTSPLFRQCAWMGQATGGYTLNLGASVAYDICGDSGGGGGGGSTGSLSWSPATLDIDIGPTVSNATSDIIIRGKAKGGSSVAVNFTYTGVFTKSLATLYALNVSGNVVLTGTNDVNGSPSSALLFHFNPVNEVTISGFKLVITTGLGSYTLTLGSSYVIDFDRVST